MLSEKGQGSKIEYIMYDSILGFSGDASGKESTCQCTGDVGSIPGLGRYPGLKKWQPTPVFLPGKIP